MPVTQSPIYIKEPTPLQCGQAVLAMLTGKTVLEIIELAGTEKETTLKDMFRVLDHCNVKYKKERIQVKEKSELPAVCFLSLETPRCWHWSLYFNGTFYDPEHGVLNDFPPSERKYYWEIINADT